MMTHKLWKGYFYIFSLLLLVGCSNLKKSGANNLSKQTFSKSQTALIMEKDSASPM
jgi:outer membrane biogenesis lipoprotein LolB